MPAMTFDLFSDTELPPRPPQRIADSAWLLPGFVDTHRAEAIVALLRRLVRQAPLRRLQTRGGHWMSVETASCGRYGWISDRAGYGYSERDPVSGQPWPEMPPLLRQLAQDGARQAGFADFAPDCCLINGYRPGAKMGLHQDRDERDFSQPIVSLSLGLPAIFLWGGLQRSDPVRRIGLMHGDLMVWGGPSRLVYHGVAPLRPGRHPLLGEWRLNLTFRRAR
jgi:alkylated DNA repair protein (DNA oxidative demethylase)